MAITGTEIGQVSIMKGNKVNLPPLPDGVMAVTEDTKELFIGVATETIKVGVINPWGDFTSNLRSAIRAYQSTPQALSANVAAKINYQTTISDSLNEYNPTLSRFTASNTGHFLVVAYLSIPNITTAARFFVNVFVNGSENVRVYDNFVPANNSNSVVGGACIITLNTGDYIEVLGFCSSNVTLEATATRTIFEITRIA